MVVNHGDVVKIRKRYNNHSTYFLEYVYLDPPKKWIRIQINRLTKIGYRVEEVLDELPGEIVEKVYESG